MAQTNLNLTDKAEKVLIKYRAKVALKGRKINKHEAINELIEAKGNE